MEIKRTHFFYLFFIFGLIACAHGKNTGAVLPTAPVSYRSPGGAYKLTYDLNRWRILRGEERQVVMDQAEFVLADGEARHFMAVSTVEAERTVGELRTRALLALQRKGPDLKVLAQEAITVSTVPAIRVSVAVTVRGLPLRYELAFLQYGGQAFEIAYWADAKRFEERLPDFGSLLETFQLRRSTPAPSTPPSWVAYPSPARGYIISLPAPTWRASAEKAVEDADRHFETESRLGYLVVIPERYEGTLQDFQRAGLERLQKAAGELQILGMREVEVDGVRALAVEARINASSHVFRYALLFAVKEGRGYQFAAWAPADFFEAELGQQVEEIFSRISFF